MKKILALLLALVMVASMFVGCGNTNNPSNNDGEKVSAESVNPTDKPNDNVGGDDNINDDGNNDDGNNDDGNNDDGNNDDNTPSLEGKAVITLVGATFADGKTTATYDVDTLVSVIAPEKNGETFIAWKDSEGNVLERLNDYDFVATENVTLTAEYVKTTSEGELLFDTDDGKTYYVAGIGTWTGNTLVIPDTYNGKPVTRIGNNAFKGNKEIINLILPESIETIGDGAFEDCSSLKTINLPKSLSEAPDLDGCDSLTIVYYDINDCYTVFYYGVRRVIVGDGVSIVKLHCYDLKDITIPSTVIDVSIHLEGEWIYTINYQGTLDDWVTTAHSYSAPYRLNCKGGIPDEYTVGVSEIVKGAFAGMKNLKKVIIPGNVSGDFEGLFRDSSITSITLMEGITKIEETMFSGCCNLEEVNLPCNLYEGIGFEAFTNCKALKSIVLPIGMGSLSGYAFLNCTSLSSIVFPADATEIGYLQNPHSNWKFPIFEGCDNLKEWTLSPFTTTIYSDHFATYPSKINFIGTQSEWENGLGSQFGYVFSGAEIVFKANTVYDFDGGLRYTSNGDGTCWASIIPNTEVTNFVIPKESPSGDKVIWIPSFRDNSTVESIEIYAEFGTLSNSFVYRCPSLTTLVLHDGITEIVEYAIILQDSPNINNLTLPKSLQFLGKIDVGNLEIINFNGTKEEWHSIQKADNLCYKTVTVRCSDGDIIVEYVEEY